MGLDQQLSHEKKLLLSIESWLFIGDPYNGLSKIPTNLGNITPCMMYIYIYPKQTVFSHCSVGEFEAVKAELIFNTDFQSYLFG